LQNKLVIKNSTAKTRNRFKKLEFLKSEMEALIESGFTGYLKINFTQGNIARIEKFEEILKTLKNTD
jgi:hypothetical protein